MATLGQELREERERRSVSLKEIADRTKIGTRILIALENDQWELMPQNFFIKGVIKAYTQAIGVDPAVYLVKYDQQREAGRETTEKTRNPASRRMHQVPDEDLFESAERRPRQIKKILIIALPILLIAAALYFLLIKPRPEPAPAKPAAEVAAKTAEIRTETPPPAQKPPVVESGLRLEFRFNADSWMHVTADGVVVMNGIQAAGTSATLRAEREFVLQTGNAGAFDFTLNGRPGRPLGGMGIVLTDIRINLENYLTFLKEEASPSPNADGR